MKRRNLTRYVLALMIVALSYAPGAGQNRDEKVFDPVPAALRARLIERLNLFLKFDRSGLYERKFELLSDYDRNHWKVDKVGYTKLMEYMQASGKVERNIEFTITHLQNWSMSEAQDQGNVMIHGRSRFWRGKSIRTGTRLLEARFEKGEWYFSEWLKEATVYQRPVF
jgi:hypothetical protein